MNIAYKTFIFFLTFPFIVHSQHQNIKFEQVSAEQGLSRSFINCILQDSHDFLWFGSALGLKKFDGYRFINYRNDPVNPSSLSDSQINTLYEDDSGYIWIGTSYGGLNRFNRLTEEFTHYKFREDSLRENKLKAIHSLLEDQYGVLWIGTNRGLYYLDRDTKFINKFSSNQVQQDGIEIERAWTLYEDSEGTIWIGTWRGLIKFDRQKNTLTHYKHDPSVENSLSNDLIRSIAEDKFGNLLIGTDNGLNKFDKQENGFSSYLYEPTEAKIGIEHQIRLLFPSKSGITWIASGTGLLIFDPKNETIIDFRNSNKYDILKNQSIMALYEDMAGILWIGTYSGEIFKYNRDRLKFIHYHTIEDYPLGISHNFLLGIYKDSNGSLWVGTAGGGLNELTASQANQILPEWIHYKHDPLNPQSISDNGVYCIYEDSDRILWIGTGSGLNKLVRRNVTRADNKNQTQRSYFTHYINGSKISYNDVIFCILEDTNNNLWLGTHYGLYKFDRSTESFIYSGGDPQNRDNIGNNRVNCIYESKSGHIWIGSWYAGLYKFDPETEIFRRYSSEINNPNSLSSNNVLMIHENQDSSLWIATTRGINRFDPHIGNCKRYAENEGLPSDDVYAILDDEEGNIWLSCGKGIYRYSPKNGFVRSFDTNDGLQSMEFNFYSYHKDKKGWMYFGGVNGLNTFHPDSIMLNNHVPKIVLTDFQIFNKTILPGINSPIDRSITEEDEIILTHDQSVFSFGFSALDYYNPQKNLYAYKMEGVDPDWVFTDASRRFATYTQLDPGEYTFRVKGSNNDGIWNEEGTSIKIIIFPPWWRTNWAYSLYVLLILSLVYGVWRFQTNRLKMKQQMEMEHFEAEKVREVDQMKSRFFANISHEFRTPLTLIKGPVKQIMESEIAENLKENCKIVLRNSDRLLVLINQILELSKLESGEMKLKVAETDIVKFSKGLVLSFSSLAERKKITLRLNAKNIFGFIDRDKFEKIITNLLSNAFKFTPEGGEIIVDCGLRIADLHPPMAPLDRGEGSLSLSEKGDKGDCIEIKISNSGPGIPADQIDKIFDRYYQSDTNYKKDGEGTGIGLALTKELVEVCRGEISVESKKIKQSLNSPFVKGEFETSFTVVLPIAKEYFKEDEIIKKTETGDDITESGDRRPETEKQISYVNMPVEDTNAVFEEKSKSSIRIPDSGLRSPLLLIVEDNPDVTEYISSFMRNDYRLITAENGKEGLKKAIDKYPDLIISDVMMPEMDGFELCKMVKTDERISHIPVILLTAKADLDSKIEGLEFGADDYITKPFEARELLIRSKNLIEQRKKLREKFSLLMDLKPEDIAASSMDEQLLQRLLAVFKDHMEEPEFSIEQLAREIGMSRIHLNRKIHALTNLSTRDFIRTLRLQRAARLLSSASGTVSEIAYRVGFNNLSYFSRAFRKHFGKLPSDFTPQK